MSKRSSDTAASDCSPLPTKVQKALSVETWVQELASLFTTFKQTPQLLLVVPDVGQLKITDVESYFSNLPEEPTFRQSLESFTADFKFPLLPSQRSSSAQALFAEHYGSTDLYDDYFDNIWKFLLERTRRIRYFRCCEYMHPILCALTQTADSLNVARLVLWERTLLLRHIAGNPDFIRGSVAYVVTRFLGDRPMPSPLFNADSAVLERMFYDVFIARPCSQANVTDDFSVGTSQYERHHLPLPTGRTPSMTKEEAQKYWETKKLPQRKQHTELDLQAAQRLMLNAIK